MSKFLDSQIIGLITDPLLFVLFFKIKKNFFLYKFIYFTYFWLRWVFVVGLGLSLVVASRGYSPLRCAGFSLGGFPCCRARALGARTSVVVAHRLSSCGTRAQWGMWDLPAPGLEPMSPALAGGFLSTVPPGKPCIQCFKGETLLQYGYISFHLLVLLLSYFYIFICYKSNNRDVQCLFYAVSFKSVEEKTYLHSFYILSYEFFFFWHCISSCGFKLPSGVISFQLKDFLQNFFQGRSASSEVSQPLLIFSSSSFLKGNLARYKILS